MKSPSSRKKSDWPQKASCGRISVSVYRRKTPLGGFAYMVANYSERKRRFDCYATPEEALEEAGRLAKRLSERDVMSASMTKDQAIEYASAAQSLAVFGVSLAASAATVVQGLKTLGSLGAIQEAVRFYAARRKLVTKKPVREAVDELLKLKEARKASPRYLQDLDHRLKKFAADFKTDTCNVTTAEIQTWLDGQKLSTQSCANYRRVLHLFFKFAVARAYASDNPVAGVETIKVRGGEVEIFTPSEIARLLAAASPTFLPALAIGAFAGLRSAEIERLHWSNIDLAARHIIVGADRSKTATRRIVPIADNLAAWLAPYAEQEGKIWPGEHDAFYDAQQDTAAATLVKAEPEHGIKSEKPVKWKSNALRHSYASYRFAQTNDAGRVAGECGNSASVIHKFYRELVKPADAEKWFGIAPQSPTNIVSMAKAA